MDLIIFFRKVWQVFIVERRLPLKVEQRLGPYRQAWRTTRDLHLTRLKLLFSRSLSWKEKSLLCRLSLRMHKNDDMYRPSGARPYLLVGLSAIRCIENALQRSGDNVVKAILDFPCGHGRVLRFLRARFPNAEITVSEIDSTGLDFCRTVFNVKTCSSNIDFNKVVPSGTFSLIWCGSLFTHIDEEAAIDLLNLFYRHLAPGGLCVFTTHGRRSVEWIEKGKQNYDLSVISRNKVLSEFYERGYGHASYENSFGGYGVSVASHDRMLALASRVGHWKKCFFLEQGWDNHQDVYGFTIPMPDRES